MAEAPGKTRTGSELTHQATKITPRLALVAAAGPDLRETMIGGRSGLLSATAKPGEKPVWEPSRKRLTWPNGCIGQGFSAEEPDRLRGPENGYAWVDEPAHYPFIEDVWTMLDLNLRIPVPGGVKVVATSTPKPSKWLKGLIADETTVVHRVSTYANAHNLDPAFKREDHRQVQRAPGWASRSCTANSSSTLEGALWTYDIIHWVPAAPHLDRIVVAVDPAGSTDKRADETGIIVIGKAGNMEYVLADLTGKYTPDQWGRKVWGAVDEFSADAVVAEKNYGGQMVFTHVLETNKPKNVDARIIMVDSRRGKALRAEPVVARYERTVCRSTSGNAATWPTWETEQTNWVPGEGPSPNRGRRPGSTGRPNSPRSPASHRWLRRRQPGPLPQSHPTPPPCGSMSLTLGQRGDPMDVLLHPLVLGIGIGYRVRRQSDPPGHPRHLAADGVGAAADRRPAEGWAELIVCPFCVAPYLMVVQIAWFLLLYENVSTTHFLWFWVLPNAWWAFSYVASIIVAYDQPEE